MTTGDPLVVQRGDEAAADADQAAALGRHRDQGAGAGAARAHRLVHRARPPAVVAEAMVALVLGTRLPREVRRRPHRRRASRPSAPTGSASVGGGSGRERRDPARRRRGRAARARVRRLHGRRQVERRRAGGGRARRRAARLRPRARARARRADRDVLRPRGRDGVPRARGGAACCACSRAPDARAIALGGGSLGSDARARGAARPHRRPDRGRAPTTPGGARRARAARSRATRTRFDAAARASAARVYESTADAILPPADRGVAARALPALRARCATGRRRAPSSSGRAAASGDYPVFARARADRQRLLPTRSTAAASSSPTRTSPGCHRVAGDWPHAIPAGETEKTLARAEAVLRSDGARRRRPRRPRRRRRRRRGRRPRRLLRRRLPARHPRRAGADDARRAGRLRVRRQDRRRPARGQELRRRLPPAERGARRPRGARHAAARGARGRLRGGRQDRADRRRRRCGHASARAASPTTTSSSAACAPSSRSSPRTSATPAAARCSTSATRSATRSRRPPATRATATARRSRSACCARCGCRAATRCAPRSASCSPRTGLPLTLRRRVDRRGRRAHRARDKKRRGGTVPFVLVRGAGRRHARPRRARADDAARRDRRGARVIDGTASPSCTASTSTSSACATPSVYGGQTLTELEVRVKRFAHELGLEPTFSQTNHEGEFCELLHEARETADGLILNPGAWTHYSYAIRDALEVSGLPAVEVHISEVDEREEWRRALGDPRPLHRARAGQGRRRLPRGARDAAEAEHEPARARPARTGSRRCWPSASSTRCSSRTSSTSAT